MKKNPEFQETLLEKAAAAEHGDLNLNKTPEEMEEVIRKVDLALGRVEEELAAHTGGEQVEKEKAVVVMVVKNCLKFLTVHDSCLNVSPLPSEHAGWWLCGELFSIADIDLSILLNRLYLLGHERRFWTEGKRPHIQGYWERIQQRTSFKVL